MSKKSSGIRALLLELRLLPQHTPVMPLRINDFKLPLDHGDAALRDAVLATLRISPQDLLDLQIVRRAYDAREKSAIQLIYYFDVVVTASIEQELLAQFQGSTTATPAPTPPTAS